MYTYGCVQRDLLVYVAYPDIQLYNDNNQYVFAPKHIFVVLREIFSSQSRYYMRPLSSFARPIRQELGHSPSGTKRTQISLNLGRLVV